MNADELRNLSDANEQVDFKPFWEAYKATFYHNLRQYVRGTHIRVLNVVIADHQITFRSPQTKRVLTYQLHASMMPEDWKDDELMKFTLLNIQIPGAQVSQEGYSIRIDF